MTDVTERFSNRVDNYIRYRPGYPAGAIEALASRCGLGHGSVVADIGSGTGILTGQLLDAGCTVFGIEPNREMRQAAERLLLHYPAFTSINGRAESTSLPDSSVDVVTAGQAFHWFDPDAARREFLRILKPGGWVVLMWNERLVDSSSFSVAYESLLKRYATDYEQVDHRRFDAGAVSAFFEPGECASLSFDNVQTFDYEGLEGRLLSSSYAPDEDHPGYAPMLAELKRIFNAEQQGGTVNFLYLTRVYYGKLQG